MYGFAKSNRDNVARNEIKEFKKLAKILFDMSDAQLELMLQNGDLDELHNKGGLSHD